MGGCLSKKDLHKDESPCSVSTPHPNDAAPKHAHQLKEINSSTATAASSKGEEGKKETMVKKPVFLIAANTKKTKCQERGEEEKIATEALKMTKETIITAGSKEEECPNGGGGTNNIRTSNCTKEEVDAILIQCGRLSRNSSGRGENSSNDNNRNITSSGSKKYAGSKRSYDFDNDSSSAPEKKDYSQDDKQQLPQIGRHRRTPSKEREKERERDSELRRSGSRDEGRRSGVRRASRSPGRRPGETPSAADKPITAKMVSVPATARETTSGGIKRVSVKKEAVGGSTRSSASPRCRSPANATRATTNENAAHPPPQPTLSRNSSRKAEQSPYRRNPLKEIDDNQSQQLALKNEEQLFVNKATPRSKECEEGIKKTCYSQLQQGTEERTSRAVEISQGTNGSDCRDGIRQQLMSYRSAKEQQLEQKIAEVLIDAKGPVKSNDLAETECRNPPQTITRSRSSRRSRDLDMHLDTLLNPSSSYASLLEDIHNYHQNHQNTAFSLPPCVTKACSILDAVADLNSCANSTLSEDKSSETDHANLYNTARKLLVKDPLVESEVVVNDHDHMEPSLHKYVTVRDFGGDLEQQESAGSNSFPGHPWSSSWEPNSADSTDHWTSLSNTGAVVEQHLALNETTNNFDAGRKLGHGTNVNSRLPGTTASGKKRDHDHQGGITGNGKGGVRSFSVPIAAASR